MKSYNSKLKIFHFALLLLTLHFALLTLARSIFAQEQPIILITTTYSSRSELDTLFQNSSRVLKYLDGDEVDKPIFLSLVTPTQEKNLQAQSFTLQIIDENTDISRYKLYFTYESNRSDLLKSVGEVFPLTPHHTLLRFPVDASTENPEGFDVEFFESPFISGSLPTPKFQAKTITPATTPIPEVNPEQKPQSSSLPFLIMAAAIVFILLFLLKRRGWPAKDIILTIFIVLGVLVIVKLLL